MAKEIKEEVFTSPEIEVLLSVIDGKLGITYEQMRSASRLREIVFARRVLCVIARRHWDMTYEVIGRLINKDHSSVIYYIKKHDHEYEKYPDYSRMYKTVFGEVQALFLAKTDFNPEFLALKIEQLTEQKRIINAQIDSYKNRIKNLQG